MLLVLFFFSKEKEDIRMARGGTPGGNEHAR